jgi:tRNA(His) 5'-end guanylyltransferase
MDSLGDRIKGYEKIFSFRGVKRIPLMIRVDGKAFHTFTKNFIKPFDNKLMEAMINSALYVAKNMQGFKIAYVQSDEVTFLLTDYDSIETEGWFDYKLTKVISTSAALMSVIFNNYIVTDKLPTFDSRAFTVPKDDVINAFLWRAKDWERNSLQMYCRSFFSHAELNKKRKNDMHKMLHKIGKNWSNDLTNAQKNGTFIINTDEGIVIRDDILPTYKSLSDNLKNF